MVRWLERHKEWEGLASTRCKEGLTVGVSYDISLEGIILSSRVASAGVSHAIAATFVDLN